jgi:hypothetical protein
MTASGPFSDKAPDASGNQASEPDAVKPNFPHPITPEGIAAYAGEKRVFFTATIAVFAILCSFCISVMVNRCLIQPLNLAIGRLPAQGAISNGVLVWFTNEHTVLIETRSVSIHVNPSNEEPIADSADLQVVFCKDKLLLRSLFGWLTIPYPKSLNLPLNYNELWTVWGAYRTAIIPVVFFITSFFIPLVWITLGIIYKIPVALMSKVLKRKVDSKGIFRISTMSQMLPAAIMCAGILLYSFYKIDITTLLIIFAIHIPLGWIYLFITPFYLPKIPEEAYNPFKV